LRNLIALPSNSGEGQLVIKRKAKPFSLFISSPKDEDQVFHEWKKVGEVS
jgi:hypothetical protein